MKRRLALVLSLVPFLGGCFDIEQGVQLNEDFSGTATFNFVIDMEPMVLIMASMTKAMSGDESPPTAEELAAARTEFLAQKETDKDWSLDKARAEEELPEGVRLLSFEPVEQDLRFGARIKLGFDHFARLQEINFASDGEEHEEPEPAMGPSKPAMLDQPFAGLVFTDEGDTMLVTSAAENPLESMQADNPMADQDMGEMKDLISQSLERLRVATSLTLPFDIVEHNATRVDGNTLWWEYDLATFEGRTPEQLAEGVRVRFKK